ncbi:hypothetical protein [Rathayibacter rathayi]|uniref:hypothetical protein n=1 Tax=Rathayibacter rathayi TaxID=33887 RepID=UPI000CE755CA|nr:hypothetical protein [Rathayibacter rathayi]PPF22271.1 hypothetical protein C5C34_11545 [Rathayibacter rathayi]PPG91034.1 hypothetical protein C5C22_14650 [Rathayibacter rathayi]
MQALIIGAVALTAVACTSALPKPTPELAPTSTETRDGDIDEATQAYLKETSAALAAQLGIVDPPPVTPVRLITLNEYADTQLTCLTDAGFDVTLTADGQGLVYPKIDDEGLQQAFDRAVYVCELEYPTQRKYMEPLSTAALEQLYDYRSGELVRCLADRGFGSASEAPSKTVFVDSGGVWSPYKGLSIPESDAAQVYDECPQTPDSLYGS